MYFTVRPFIRDVTRCVPFDRISTFNVIVIVFVPCFGFAFHTSTEDNVSDTSDIATLFVLYFGHISEVCYGIAFRQCFYRDFDSIYFSEYQRKDPGAIASGVMVLRLFRLC